MILNDVDRKVNRSNSENRNIINLKAELKQFSTRSVITTFNERKYGISFINMSQQWFGLKPPNFVDGLRIPQVFKPETFRSAIRYKPLPDDVFIVTYPKCGTTWTHQIICLILKQKELCNLDNKLFGEDPSLELRGGESTETMPRPRAIKTHLPFHFTPWSDQAKYIHITRNPKDCCVSYYHHSLSDGFNGSFDQFFEMFLSGDVDFGDYFDHLLGWYEHRNDPNVLFVTYEEIKEDPGTVILKMASFINDEKYAEPLRKDPELLNEVVKYSSFQYMKEAASKRAEEKAKEYKKQELNSVNTLAQNSEIKIDVLKIINVSNLVRKGVVGDWRSHFSEEQCARLEQKFTEKTKGTDLANIWVKHM
ncbi:hypothetical protein CDAR_601641 [Caerostris darwini]|uniref:Sulfotransferase domain-containing protein n=1 Tax=Caerostris darwini TaxID=1538125 RepID=A0AAV4R3N4_9ARAC|nr:hypothetical protein CDAR_601641 [Caerostris darwini]